MSSPRPGRALLIALPFLLPNFLGFLFFTAGPVAASLAASFSDWNLQSTEAPRWVGLDNFQDLVGDANFWHYFLNTLYLMMGIPFAIAGSLWLAILLHRRTRGVIVYRTLFYLPSFTSGVALMILWKALYNPDFGPINEMIRGAAHLVGFGPVNPPHWLGSMANLVGLTPESFHLESRFFGLGARDALIFMGVWTAIGGNNMLLYLAALGNVSPELQEAAEIDGAGRWAVFRHITWPQLMPTTFFIVIMSMIGGLQGGFEQARVMTEGGPAETTTTLSYYIYTKAFQEFQMGYASAVSWMLFMMIFAFTLVYWRWMGKENVH